MDTEQLKLMSAELNDAFKDLSSLHEALAAAIKLGLREGLIKVESTSLSGCLRLADGKIQEVTLDQSAETGRQALASLAGIASAKISFIAPKQAEMPSANGAGETPSTASAVDPEQTDQFSPGKLRPVRLEETVEIPADVIKAFHERDIVEDVTNKHQPATPDTSGARPADAPGLLKSLASQEDKQELSLVSGLLDNEAAKLLVEQQALLDIMKQSGDREEFEAKDPTLSAHSSKLVVEDAPAKWASREADQQELSAVSGLLNEEQSSLSSQQAALLDVMKFQRHEEEFQSTHPLLSPESQELVISEEEMWILGEKLSERPREEHKKEFIREDPSLKSEETILPQPPVLSQTVQLDVDAVVDEQFAASGKSTVPDRYEATTRADQPAAKRSAMDHWSKDAISNKGPMHSLASMFRQRQTEMPTGVKRIVIATLFSAACILLFAILPSFLRGGNNQSDALTAAQMNRYMAEEENSAEAAEARRHSEMLPPAQASSAPSPAPAASSGDASSTSTNITAGAGVQQTVDQNQKLSAEERIALIRSYLKQKRAKDAIVLAIRGLKSPCTPEQKQIFMQLFQQAQSMP